MSRARVTPVRALHVIPAVAESDGGPTVAVLEMTRALVQAGLHVEIATTNADGSAGRLEVPLDVPSVTDGVTFRYFARTARSSWKPSLALSRWLREHARSFDVVHVHGMFTFSTFAACRAARAAHVPYVMHPLGTLGAWSLGHRAWKKRPYYWLVEQGHLRHAAAVHVTSESERAAVAALGFDAKARLVPLGVTAPAANSPVVRSARDEGASLRVLVVARLHPVKGHPVLLDAVAIARDRLATPIHLTLAGDGDAAYRATLVAQADRLGLGDSVRFVGHVSGEAKTALLSDADAFALPSHHENFGIAVAEAMAAGLPVVVSDQVGIAPDVLRGGAGLVTRVDAEELAQALVRLARDPAERLRMGAEGAAFAQWEYSWAAVAQRLIGLYDEVIAAAPPISERARAGGGA